MEMFFYFFKYYTKAKKKQQQQQKTCNVRTLQQNSPRKPTTFLTSPTEYTRGDGWGMGMVFEGPKLCQLRI